MMWSQEIVRGRLAGIGDGTWSGDTFRASFIGIGERRLEGIRVARCLLERMEAGREMELLVCSAHIYGVRVDGEVFREGALRQLGWALLVAVALGWILLPLAAASLIFIRRSYAIYSF